MRPGWAQQAGHLLPSVLRRYLATAGWESLERKKAWRFSKAASAGEIFVDVPKSQDLADYERRVVELVEVLAAVEERSPLEVLLGLANPTADCLAFRFSVPDTESGTISVSDGCRIRDAQRRLLLSAAHSVVEPQAHHPRLSRAEAVAFLETCREAPSQHGSFVANILIPVAPPVGQLPLDDPFPRQVTRLLARALHETSEAISQGKDHRLLESARDGLSSNLLKALSDLHPPGQHGTLEIGFSWAPGRPAPGSHRRVRFDRSFFPNMAEAARVLRETSPMPGTTVEGYFARFERDAQDATSPGEVALLATLDEHPGQTKVYMILSQSAYAEAWQAHQDAAKVRITGTLTKERRRYVLRSPGDVERVPEEE
ncbi:MAG: hypothetical protein KDK70_36845 [Myxococcales bacterium]|nr:hypothetical protein [Myxococcales bacterium]